jgi:hypothetical protein
MSYDLWFMARGPGYVVRGIESRAINVGCRM